MSHRGPNGSSLLRLYQFTVDPFKYLNEWAEKYGTPFHLRLFGYGNFIIFSDPKHVEEIFHGSPEALHSGEGNARLFSEILGRSSILVLDESAHKEHRRLLMPPFHGERIRVYTNVMGQVAAHAVDSWPIGKEITLDGRLRDITLEIILRNIFGAEDRDELKKLSDVFRDFFSISSHPLTVFAMGLPRKFLKATPQWFRTLRRVKAVDDVIYRYIAARKSASGQPDRDDILSLLLAAKHEDGQPMSDRELRDELFTMVVAGFETTAVATEWVLREILSHPEVLQKVLTEIATVGSGAGYLDAVLKEALRLRPVVPWVLRRTTSSFVVGGTTYPAGTNLAASMFLTQRRADVYPEPTSFKPERFLEKKPSPYEWYPFGGSDRRCIGMAFATLEMKVVLTTIISRLNLELTLPSSRVKTVRRGILSAPSDRTKVLILSRKIEPTVSVQAA